MAYAVGSGGAGDGSVHSGKIGYNVSKASRLADEIAENFNEFGNKIQSDWENVVTVLQKEWIGVDEQSFEKTFAKKICELYESAYNLTKTSISTIIILANDWIKFQQKNLMEGDTTSAQGSLILLNTNDTHGLVKKNEIVKYKERTFTENMDMGLASQSSATTCYETIKTFATTAQTSANDLFETIQSGGAFFGEQSNSINAFVKKVGEAVGKITVAVSDVQATLEEIMTTQYGKAQTAAEESFQEATTTLDNDIKGFGNWE